jgi:phage shock protein PspC (stress-responsive transcriptional regulator)/predicted membrane protein
MVEDETSTSAPPPPTEQPRVRPELRRSRDNRVVAGVAAGIGRYFDVDPVIVRIAFIVLSVFGGSGVLLYLVAWLVIAKEGEDDSAAGRALKGSDHPRGRGVVAALLLLAAIFIMTGPVLWFADLGFGDGLFFPLLLVAAGIALLLWPEDEGWSAIRPRGSSDDPSTASGGPTPTDVAAASSTELVRRSDALAEAEPAPPSFPPQFPPPPDPPIDTDADLPGQSRRSFPVTTLTMALMLVMTGGAVLLDRLDIIELRPVSFLAAILVVIGTGLVVAAFVGRARGLIVLGLLILPWLWFATVVDIEWWSGVGEDLIVVDDPRDLADAYHHGIGHLVVDLRDLDLDGETAELEVGLTIGEVVVYVPDDLEVQVDLDGRIGQVSVERPGRDLLDDGIDISIDTTLPGDNGVLVLDLDVGIGEARVEVTR